MNRSHTLSSHTLTSHTLSTISYYQSRCMSIKCEQQSINTFYQLPVVNGGKCTKSHISQYSSESRTRSYALLSIRCIRVLICAMKWTLGLTNSTPSRRGRQSKQHSVAKTHTYTHTHKYTHTHTHTHIHRHTHTYQHSYTHSHTHTNTYIQNQRHIHIHTQTQVHSLADTHTHIDNEPTHSNGHQGTVVYSNKVTNPSPPQKIDLFV